MLLLPERSSSSLRNWSARVRQDGPKGGGERHRSQRETGRERIQCCVCVYVYARALVCVCVSVYVCVCTPDLFLLPLLNP